MNSQPLTIDSVKGRLAKFADPETGRDLVSTGQVQDLTVTDESVSFTLALTTHSALLGDETVNDLKDRLKETFPQLRTINVEQTTFERPPMQIGQIGLRAKTVIAVASGKGGVGKSTLATSLAYGFQQGGCKVGLLDADVYGPSIPHLVGAEGKPEINENKKLVPHRQNGLQIMSMG
ncbi:MAG: Mrp/NBP35 family ATP-binding protein, partial [Pirellulaceae bacterium]|nr:Mrp/NBP35 family ATP-binding protein [Pirellulaceae bacterium]